MYQINTCDTWLLLDSHVRWVTQINSCFLELLTGITLQKSHVHEWRRWILSDWNYSRLLSFLLMCKVFRQQIHILVYLLAWSSFVAGSFSGSKLGQGCSCDHCATRLSMLCPGTITNSQESHIPYQLKCWHAYCTYWPSLIQQRSTWRSAQNCFRSSPLGKYTCRSGMSESIYCGQQTNLLVILVLLSLGIHNLTTRLNGWIPSNSAQTDCRVTWLFFSCEFWSIVAVVGLTETWTHDPANVTITFHDYDDSRNHKSRIAGKTSQYCRYRQADQHHDQISLLQYSDDPAVQAIKIRREIACQQITKSRQEYQSKSTIVAIWQTNKGGQTTLYRFWYRLL